MTKELIAFYVIDQPEYKNVYYKITVAHMHRQLYSMPYGFTCQVHAWLHIT